MAENTNSQGTCPQCGALVPKEAAHGLCPRCVFARAMSVTGEQQVIPPDLEVVRAAFPQLDVISLIGAGGMGSVFRARQPQLDRVVALKLLATGRTDDTQFATRFQREAQALARLSHPHIITIHDFGEAAGFYFLLMEYVDGVNLRQAMAAGRLTPEQAVAIVPPICEALQYAHDRGIVHRDIKPENLLLDRDGRLKIADFGIARILGAADGTPVAQSKGEDLTQADALGTPSYMAPEQRTAPQTVDHRADIYSLGVVFYEMLTGELPGNQIEPPSLKVEIDVRLDEIVLRALGASPDRRYNTALEFKTQLIGLDDNPAEARKAHPVTEVPELQKVATSSHSRRFSKSLRALKVASLVSISIFLVLIATVLIGWLLLPREHFAAATLEIERPPNRTYDPVYHEMEMKRVFTAATLEDAIRRLESMNVFSAGDLAHSKVELYERLIENARLDKERYKDNAYIKIGIYDADPRDAASIANAIALAYRDRQTDDVFRRMELVSLHEKELAELKKTVTQKIIAMAGIREELDLIDVDPEDQAVKAQRSGNEASPADLDRYGKAKEEYLSVRNRLEYVQLKIIEAKELANSEPAKIWGVAEPPASPVGISPKRLLSRIIAEFSR